MKKNKVNTTAATSMKIVAKISWAVIAVGGAIAGMCIGMGSGLEAIGLVAGLAAGVLVGFLINLLLLYFAELGLNTAKAAANKEEKQPTSAADEIKKYKEMLDNGTISQQEFEDLKRNLINK